MNSLGLGKEVRMAQNIRQKMWDRRSLRKGTSMARNRGQANVGVNNLRIRGRSNLTINLTDRTIGALDACSLVPQNFSCESWKCE